MTALMSASSGAIPRAELNRLLSSSDPISWRRSDSCLGWRWCYEEQDNAVTSGLKSMLRALASPASAAAEVLPTQDICQLK